LNKNFIYDIDDMVFLGHVSAANKFILKLKGKSKMIFLMKKAKHVITCTPALDEYVRQFTTETTDISSTINTEIYQAKRDYAVQKREIVLGWSGSHSTSKYLHLLDEVIKEISTTVSLKLKVIGDPDFKMEGVKTEAKQWNRKDEVLELSEFDIGLYPLPDEPWVYGKSGLKALQYMALGIPTVAVDLGANKRIIKSGENGFLVNSNSEWKESIMKLIESEELRRRVGENARKTVESKFSIKANEGTYLDIIKKYI
jgi:glycosyltransferase involved in cell wall biosynthesis